MTAEGRLIQECCDDCTGTNDCDPCEAGECTNPKSYFNCEPETSTHGYTGWVPYDCYDYQYTDAVWLYDMSCTSSTYTWELWQDAEGNWWGGTTDITYGPAATKITAAGRMDWSTLTCTYANSGYVLKNEDSNGKRFKQNSNNDNYSLVNDPTAPTLTMPNGRVLYTIEAMETWDYTQYTYSYFGDLVFIDTEATEFIFNDWNDNPDGLWYSVPDWVMSLRDKQIIAHAVDLGSNTYDVRGGWNQEALFCAELNQYGT